MNYTSLMFLLALLVATFSLSSCSVKLPSIDGAEKECFERLRSHPREDMEKRCMKLSLKKWRALERRNPAVGSCCVLYETLDCIQHEASLYCDTPQLAALNAYHLESLNSVEASTCQSVPYDEIGTFCKV